MLISQSGWCVASAASRLAAQNKATAVAGTAEVYWCIRGTGYMLMKTADGQCVLERMARNRLVYVPPHWAHRSINTGDEPLVSFCVYPGDAGHNYGNIATEGFPRRVFLRGGKEVIE